MRAHRAAGVFTRGEVHYIALQTGHSIVLPVKDLRRVAVGDADCLGVVAVGRSQVIL